MKVAFLVWNIFMIRHFSSIAKHFNNPDFIFFSREDSKISSEMLSALEESGSYFRYTSEKNLHNIANQYDVIVATSFPLTMKPINTKVVIIQYGLAKDKNQFDYRWAGAELGLVYGKYSQEKLENRCESIVVGNPRFDDFFNQTLDRNILLEMEEYLDRSKKTILYSPTWGELSSEPYFAEQIATLKGIYNVIYNPHHLTLIRGLENKLLDKSACISSKNLNINKDPTPYLLKISDLVISDMSGAIFDALYCNRRVVLLDNKFIVEKGHKKTSSNSLEVALRNNPCVFVQDKSNLLVTIEKEIAMPFYDDLDMSYYFGASGNGGKIAADSIKKLYQTEKENNLIASSIKKLIAIRSKSIYRQQRQLYQKYLIHIGYRKDKNITILYAIKAISHFLYYSEAIFRKFKKLTSRIFAHIINKLNLPFNNINKYYQKILTKLKIKNVGKITIKDSFRKALVDKDINSIAIICENIFKKKDIELFDIFFDASSTIRFSRYCLEDYFKSLNTQENIDSYPVKNLLELGLISSVDKNSNQFLKWKESRNWEISDKKLEIIEAAFLNTINSSVVSNIVSGQMKISTQSITDNTVEVFIPRSILFSFKDSQVIKNQASTSNIIFNIIDEILKSGKCVLPKLQGHWGSGGAPLSVPFLPNIKSISWHTVSIYPSNRLHIKYGTFEGHFSIDKLGYAGFSRFAKKSNTINPRSVDILKANEHFLHLKSEIVDSGFSKYKQSKETVNIPFKKYIFFPMQVLTDSVAVLNYGKAFSYIESIVNWLERNRDIGLVVKRHPKCKDERVSIFLNKIKKDKNVFITDSNIHHLIENSIAVFTMNSGTGAEALLHSKPVFIGGVCDYQACATVVKSSEYVSEKLDNFLEKGSEFTADEIKQFIYVYTKQYMPKANDKQAISNLLLENF